MSSGSTPLRVGVIGAGYFAGFHIEGWLRNNDTELAGIADPDTARALAHLKDFESADTIKLFASADELLDHGSLDIVDIASPPPTHLEIIEQSVRRPVRAIICQKPFCGGLDQATHAVAVAKAQGKLLVVHENFRFQPWYRRIRDEIEQGRIGSVHQVTFRMRTGDGQGADAYLGRQPYFQTMPRFLIHETGIHWIDTFRYLLGEPDGVLADLQRRNPHIEGEDSGFFIFTYGDGKRALFDGNRLVDHAAANTRRTLGECWIEGDRGVIHLNGDGELHFRPFGGTDWTRLMPAPETEMFGGDCVFRLQQHVSDHLMLGTTIENEGADYLRNMQIEEAIYRAAESGRTVDLRA